MFGVDCIGFVYLFGLFVYYWCVVGGYVGGVFWLEYCGRLVWLVVVGDFYGYCVVWFGLVVVGLGCSLVVGIKLIYGGFFFSFIGRFNVVRLFCYV